MAEKNQAYQQLKKDIADGTLQTVYIFHGEETYLREYYLSQAAKKLVPAGFEEFNYHRCEGKGLVGFAAAAHQVARDDVAGTGKFAVAGALGFLHQHRTGRAEITARAVVHLRGIAVEALLVEPFHHFMHIVRAAFDDGTVFVLIAQHQAVVAAGELLQAGAHALARRPCDEHLLHQPVDFLLCEGHEARGMQLAVAALAYLRIIIIADAVGPAACLFRDLFKNCLQGQTLLLCFICSFPKEPVFAFAPAGAPVVS